jgi:hypothetical protein
VKRDEVKNQNEKEEEKERSEKKRKKKHRTNASPSIVESRRCRCIPGVPPLDYHSGTHCSTTFLSLSLSLCVSAAAAGCCCVSELSSNTHTSSAAHATLEISPAKMFHNWEKKTNMDDEVVSRKK